MSNISVIIPTWNRAHIITKAIESALNQTKPPLEVIICDDGSLDNTEEVIKDIAKRDSRVRWIGGCHSGGPAVPRNKGIAGSRGEWLSFLDSDDEWVPEKLERQLEIAKKTGCKAVCSNAYRKVPDKGIVGKLLNCTLKRFTFQTLLRENLVVCSSAMIHRSLIDDIKGFPEDKKVIEDYALWLRVATLTDFAFDPNGLVIYNDDSSNSVRGTVTSNVWLQRKYVLKDFCEWGWQHQIPLLYRYTAKTYYYMSLLRLLKQNVNLWGLK